MKHLLYSIAVFSLFFLAPSCKKEDPDTQAPVIVKIEEPADGDTIMAGSNMHVEFTITDNVALSQLKIDIHSAEDGHSHGKLMHMDYWEQVILVPLSGTSSSQHIDVPVPATAAAGKYHVIFTAVDKAGNQSAFVEVDIIIRNPSDLVPPVVSIISPGNGQSFSAGTPISVIALLEDNVELAKAEIEIYRGSTKVYEKKFNNLSGVSTQISETVSTTGWTAGTYKVEVIAKDGVLNKSDAEVSISIN